MTEWHRSRGVLYVFAVFWGIAEATLFFIVPDVLLTFVALRSFRRSMVAAVFALAGALAGGFAMLQFAMRDAAAARALLDAIPGISSPLIDRVAAMIASHGAFSVLVGPIKGIPYKIFAAEWGAAHLPAAAFVLVSIPARFVRFALTALVAHLVANALPARIRRYDNAILAAVWVAFYTFYFVHFSS